MIGAGGTAELVAQALVARGVQTVFVANRHHDRALGLAERFDGEAIRFEDLPEQLAEVDVVVSTTNSPHHIIERDGLEQVMAEREARPLLLIDIAVPRDIEPDCREVAGGHRLRHRRRPADRRTERRGARSRGDAGGTDHRGRARPLPALARLARGGADDRRAARARRRGRAPGAGRERKPLGGPRRGRPGAGRADGEGDRLADPARTDPADPPRRRPRRRLPVRERAARAVRSRRRDRGRVGGRRRGQGHRAAPRLRAELAWPCASPPGQPACADPGRDGRRDARRRRAGRGLLRRRCRATNRASCARSSRRCSTGAPTSACTRRRTCRARRSRGWRSPRCRRARTRPTPGSAPATSLEDAPEGARVGTVSLRRKAQLLAARPDLEVLDLNGNVDTRLRKLAEGDYDAIILAAAGLRRLGRESEIGFRVPEDRMVPAAGQGALAVQVRSGDEETAAAVRAIGDAARPSPSCAPSAPASPASRPTARPRSASTPGSTASACGSAPSSASPTAASGSATSSTPTPPTPRPRAPSWRSACSAPAPPSSSPAPRQAPR